MPSKRSFLINTPLYGLLLAGVLLIAAGCGPSEADCQKLCDWWSGYCTGETHESCMEDCADAWQDDVDYALEQCPGFSASSCKGASCCLRFVYTEYYYSQNCI